MKILKENMEELLIKTKYVMREEHEDANLNRFLNYWIFLEERETIIQELTDEPLEVILYSKYYWCSRYRNLYTKLYGIDAGVDQQQFQIIEELDQRIDGTVDCVLLQLLEED